MAQELHQDFYRLMAGKTNAVGQPAAAQERSQQSATAVSSALVHDHHVAVFNPLEQERPNGDSRRWIGHYVHTSG